MIMVGNSRANGQNLAEHLLSSENERVTVHEISGFASDDLHGAFKEAEAVSRGTQCKKYLYSLSLNPPPNEHVDTETFQAAVDQAETRLGLNGQPRAIVFHEKCGDDGNSRRHAHVVWSRIDTDKMKAVQLDFPKKKLKSLSKELYLENEWEIPAGFIDPKLRDLKTLTLSEWQQAKRFGQDPREVKAVFQDSWKRSDSKAAFANALKEHGLVIARGDRRGFVATDMHGRVYPLSRWLGIKSKDVKTRMGDVKDMPSLDDARTSIADLLSPAVGRLEQAEEAKIATQKKKQAQEREAAEAKAKTQRKLQQEWQATRAAKEERDRKDRFNNGARGLLDRMTGQHAKTKQQNKVDAYRAMQRDQAQRDQLILQQQDAQARLKAMQDQARQQGERTQAALKRDMDRLNALREKASQQTQQQPYQTRSPPARGEPER